jgi:hypothetical protein
MDEQTWAAAATAALFSPLPHSTTATLSPLLGNRLSPGSLSGSPSPVLSLPRKRRDRELYGSIQSTVPARNPSICSIPGVLVSSISSAVCCSRWWWCGAVDAMPWCCSLILWSLSTVAWCLGSLLHGVPLLGLVPWTSHSAPATALVSPSTSHRAGPDVGDRIGFLGQNLVFAELVFPRRQSTCCDLLVAFIYLLSNFVQSASIIYLVVITQFVGGFVCSMMIAV